MSKAAKFVIGAIVILLICFILSMFASLGGEETAQVSPPTISISETETKPTKATPPIIMPPTSISETEARPTEVTPPTAIPIPTLTNTPVTSTFRSPAAAIWTGVKIYYGQGEKKTYAFEIVGGNSGKCTTMSRGLLVRYPDDHTEWKDRNAVISSGIFFVDRNDPAIDAMQWHEYPGCP